MLKTLLSKLAVMYSFLRVHICTTSAPHLHAPGGMTRFAAHVPVGVLPVVGRPASGPVNVTMEQVIHPGFVFSTFTTTHFLMKLV